MNVFDCPPWCDQAHEKPQHLHHGSVTHRAPIFLDCDDDNADPISWIEQQIRWWTEGVTLKSEKSDPGICLNPYFTEVYIEPPEAAELLEALGRAQRLLPQIKNS